MNVGRRLGGAEFVFVRRRRRRLVWRSWRQLGPTCSPRCYLAAPGGSSAAPTDGQLWAARAAAINHPARLAPSQRAPFGRLRRKGRCRAEFLFARRTSSSSSSSSFSFSLAGRSQLGATMSLMSVLIATLPPAASATGRFVFGAKRRQVQRATSGAEINLAAQVACRDKRRARAQREEEPNAQSGAAGAVKKAPLFARAELIRPIPFACFKQFAAQIELALRWTLRGGAAAVAVRSTAQSDSPRATPI